MTHEELEHLVITVTRAQSMLLASVLRPFLTAGTITEEALVASLVESERAALERETPEIPALTGLIAVLREDLGLGEGNRPAAS